jgi:hypothetical protein
MLLSQFGSSRVRNMFRFRPFLLKFKNAKILVLGRTKVNILSRESRGRRRSNRLVSNCVVAGLKVVAWIGTRLKLFVAWVGESSAMPYGPECPPTILNFLIAREPFLALRIDAECFEERFPIVAKLVHNCTCEISCLYRQRRRQGSVLRCPRCNFYFHFRCWSFPQFLSIAL